MSNQIDGFDKWPPENDRSVVHDVSTPQPHPDYPEIPQSVERSKSALFGLDEISVFSRVIANRRTRLEAVGRIVSGFSGFEMASKRDRQSAASTKANEIRRSIDPNVTAKEFLMSPASRHWGSTYQARVDLNDPLIQTLLAIEQHQPPLLQADLDQLVIDSIVLCGRKVVPHQPAKYPLSETG